MKREIRELHVDHALNRVRGMPFSWSLNPYRGCQHACVYCYARTTHTYFNLSAGEDFSRILFVKTNLVDRLAIELSRKFWDGGEVVVGSATDPYQPIEGRFRLTRNCLAVLAQHHVPVSIITKGTLILRDLDMLWELQQQRHLTVLFSIPTIDRVIWRHTEPGTPPPEKRLEVLERLRRRGIQAGVMMAPILFGISDGEDQIRRTAQAAFDHGALFVHAKGVRLDAVVRKVFYAFVDANYPHLSQAYRLWYRDGTNPPGYLRRELDRRSAPHISPYTRWTTVSQPPNRQLTFNWSEPARVHSKGFAQSVNSRL